jgi:hypothetical protein
LLICKRAAVPTKLQAALREIGIEADLTRNTAGAERGDLRRYGAVAFGRAVSEPDRARMTEAFRTANPTVAASRRRCTVALAILTLGIDITVAPSAARGLT